MQPANVRQSNQRAILTVIAMEPGISNAGIARRTGLAPQTVSAVLTDLERAGLLRRGDAQRGGRRGQPATPIYIDPEGAFALGAEIGWQRIEVALTNLNAQVVRRERRTYERPDSALVFDLLAELIDDITGPMTSAERSRLIGLGLAAPTGIGDPTAVVAMPPVQGEFWHPAGLARAAARATGISDVQVMNDGNAACWAEFVAHPSPRPGNFLYVLVDSFLGAGLVAEDRLWEGANGAAANLGSMRVTGRDGQMHYAHEVASLSALHRRLEAQGLGLADALHSSPAQAARIVLDSWIDDAAFALAEAVLNAATVMDFDFAVIEGEVPEAVLMPLVESVRTSLANLPALTPLRPQVQAGHLHRSGAAQGAAFLRTYRRYFSRELADLEA
ncbi:MAG TPA: ROK family transcriptional regulator [Devosia sp.]|nr:ROK family transcriptional regulator [Devosia sp.]